MKIYWTKEALLRLQDIEEFISRDNPIASVEFIEKLISVAETIVDYPRKEELYLNCQLRKYAKSFIRIFVSYI